ncbi:peptidase M16 [Iodidimonas gelatinilytica]|uniref:Peptidase M16 n=1 Tax=Iodidimonas gelatinilytica TaxID=1236966 RepID=A0A5A7MS67_9PROT|nr:insulinase family protein [Iodidimonas gelatinilytica]GEQ98606.1 peptidase M16 [Iodidimonas gelatinilytica]
MADFYRFFARIIVLAGVIFPIAAFSQTRPLDAPSPDLAFPHERNAFGLAPDPAIHWGRLDTGLRYAIMENKTPRDQASLQLRVDVGSLDEVPELGGIAHFLEHLAFQKTIRRPDEGLFTELERLGLQSGADSNATTGLEATTYYLTVPGSGIDRISRALDIFRDISDGLLLTEEDVEQERDVVTSELVSRDSSAAQSSKIRMRFLTPGAKAAEQWPAGTRESLHVISREDLLAFYQAHYRPEKMLLVLVGDFDAEAVEAEVRARFADFKGAGVAAPDVSEERTASLPQAPRALSHVEESLRPSIAVYFEQPAKSIASQSLGYSGAYRLQKADEDTRRAVLKRGLALDFAMGAYRRRLQDLMFADDAGFSSGGPFGDHIPRAAYFAGLQFTPVGDDWRTALHVARRELDRLLAFGITEQELDLMRRSQITSLKASVDRADTRSSGALASNILRSTAAHFVVRHPSALLADLMDVVDQLSLEDVKAALKDRYEGKAPAIFVRLQNSDEPVSEAEILAEWAAAGETLLQPWQPSDDKAFAYQVFGEPGQIVSQEHIEDFDFERLTFANHVVAQIKDSDLERNTVRFSIRLGNGLSAFAPDEAGLMAKAGQWATLGGLGAHDFQELSRLFADKNMSVQLSIDGGGVRILGAAMRADLPIALQYAAALLTDPAFRPDAVPLYERSMMQLFAGLRASPQSVLRAEGVPFIFSGDQRRVGFPADLEAALAPDRETVVKRLTPLLAHEFLEVSLVGDIRVLEAQTLLANTLGALPERAAEPELAGSILPRFAANGAKAAFTYDGHDAGSRVSLYWPVRDGVERPKALALHLMTSVLDILAREDVREAGGLSYSPQASWQLDSSLGYRGLIALSADSDSARSHEVVEALSALLERVAQTAPSDDLLERARQPVMEQLGRWRDSNQGWLFGMLEGLSHAPERLKRYRTVEADYRAVTAKQVQDAAIWLLKTGAPIEIVVSPISIEDDATKEAKAPDSP